MMCTKTTLLLGRGIFYFQMLVFRTLIKICCLSHLRALILCSYSKLCEKPLVTLRISAFLPQNKISFRIFLKVTAINVYFPILHQQVSLYNGHCVVCEAGTDDIGNIGEH
jgi:hypothetical protein